MIEEAQSAWTANVVLVKKKDNTPRFCIDYRAVNQHTVAYSYPLPRIDTCLDSLSGAKYYSTLDLKSSYYQIAMDEHDADNTPFITRRGAFRWRRTPMGLLKSSMTCQKLMEIVLSGLNIVTRLIYLDDVILFSWDVETHMT